ncbi:MAG TPA: AMP-binding protein, partial [Solirubrobacteraceae bacterium]|nr:AMP-binding protein [Solirubrobacteraceae bacterium]
RELGVAAGERVGIALAPGCDFAIALHACFAAGALAVPFDPREPRERWPLAGVAAVVDRPLACAGPATARRAPAPQRPAVLVRTSGSSGTPKEIPLTFANFAWSALGSAVALGLDPRERWLCALPLVHVGGISILMRAWLTGTTAVIHERFETRAVLDALTHGGITAVSLVPTTLARLLDAGLAAPPALRVALLGGAPIAPALVERARAAGVPVSKTYGLTETCSQVATQIPGAKGDGAPPLFCTRVTIANDGEILVAGPTLSPVCGPLLATGDLGEIASDGSLRVIGRKADTIITGGENVAPAAVEAVLCAHPAIVEAAVFGVADGEWGEAVCAAVVVRAPVAQSDLREHCAAGLARHQVPKRFVVVESLPRTASGKLRRGDLASIAGL